MSRPLDREIDAKILIGRFDFQPSIFYCVICSFNDACSRIWTWIWIHERRYICSSSCCNIAQVVVGMAVVGWWWWAGGGGVQVGHKSEAAFQGQLLTAGDAIAKLPRLNTKKALIAAYME